MFYLEAVSCVSSVGDSGKRDLPGCSSARPRDCSKFVKVTGLCHGGMVQ